MYLYQYTEDDLTRMANNVKEHLLNALANQGLLKGDPKDLGSAYAVILYRKNRLGRLWDQLRGHTDEKHLCVSVVKGVHSTDAVGAPAEE